MAVEKILTYKVYRLMQVLETPIPMRNQQVLEEIKFKSCDNLFYSKEKAVDAIVSDERFEENLVILEQITVVKVEDSTIG